MLPVFRIRDPVLFYPLDPGWDKTDHFCESLETVCWVKIHEFLDLFDPGSGMEKFGSGISYKHYITFKSPNAISEVVELLNPLPYGI